MGMQQSDKIEVERLKLCNIGQNFLRVTDFTFCSFVKESFKSSLINKVVKYHIWVFSNQVWIFCSTNWSNVIFGFPAELSHGSFSRVHKYNLHN